jgi:hypothetical protein
MANVQDRKSHLPLAVSLPLAACRRDVADPAPTTSTSTFVDGPAGGIDLTVDGVRIEADPSVRFVYRSTSQTGRPTERVQTLDGHAFGVEDGVFHLGGRAYGPAPPGSTVRVSADGVLVDGEHRGALPPPADAPAADG